MDFEAELAAFEAQVETLAAKTDIDVASSASSSSAVPTPSSNSISAANSNSNSNSGIHPSRLQQQQPSQPTTSSNSAHVSSSPSTIGHKRKATSEASDGPQTKKSVNAAIVSAAPAVISAAPATNAVNSKYADLLAADRAALLAKQQATASVSSSTTGTDGSHSGNGAGSADGSSGYVSGQVYNGWLASIDRTGAPLWVEATPENFTAYEEMRDLVKRDAAEKEASDAIAQARLTKKEKKAAAAAAKAAAGGNASGAGDTTVSEASTTHLRTAAGKVWSDPTLDDWPENDHRIFCGDLGNDVTDAMLSKMFDRWSSFVKAKVVKDNRSGKSKGFGFASFLNPDECIEALKECDGKYCGNRPIKLRRSNWEKRETGVEKSWTAKHNQFGNTGSRGSKKLHLY